MAAAHTPGPWQLNFDGQVTTASGKYVVGFHWDSYKEFHDQDENHKGDCRLIAAAPELLAALQKIIEQVKSPGPYLFKDSEDLKAALSAVAKATGAAS